MRPVYATRVIGLEPEAAGLEWIGMKVKGRFRRLSQFKPTDIYIYPAGKESNG
jgi:hypothetical protein